MASSSIARARRRWEGLWSLYLAVRDAVCIGSPHHDVTIAHQTIHSVNLPLSAELEDRLLDPRRREQEMAKKRFTIEQIINHLREADVFLAQGETVGVVCRRIGVSEQSYYRWRREYGGLKVDQARRLKDLEQENARLKRAVADLTLYKLILKEAAEGNW